jgi:hypothetical protein
MEKNKRVKKGEKTRTNSVGYSQMYLLSLVEPAVTKNETEAQLQSTCNIIMYSAIS